VQRNIIGVRARKLRVAWRARRYVDRMASTRLPPDPVIEEYKKHVDMTLLRRNLHLTPEQRLRQAMKLLHDTEALRQAMRDANRRR
jgi:hypothetical protein